MASIIEYVTVHEVCKNRQIPVFLRRMIVIAHDIRSLHNIGSIFRNAAAFGIEKLYLTGFTATPPRKEIAKVALGAEDLVPWEAGTIESVVSSLKTSGYVVFGLETGMDAIEISTVKADKIALVLGNEVEGIDQATLSLLDGKLVIPMNKKQSLNVSVASGVAMYVLTR
jgi:tRNA G18 (ribose-2'-O)-methylase SpoU